MHVVVELAWIDQVYNSFLNEKKCCMLIAIHFQYLF